jgi:hypothetical protein
MGDCRRRHLERVAQVQHDKDDGSGTGNDGLVAAFGHTRRPATIAVDDMDSQTKELSEFCGVLWREREVVERVLFKVLGQQLVLQAAQTRWLVAANTEIELAVNDLRVIEVIRCAESDRLADHLGMAPGATLAELATASPEPWGSILAEHRDALRDLANEIDHAVRDNRLLLVDGATTVSSVSS